MQKKKNGDRYNCAWMYINGLCVGGRQKHYFSVLRYVMWKWRCDRILHDKGPLDSLVNMWGIIHESAIWGVQLTFVVALRYILKEKPRQPHHRPINMDAPHQAHLITLRFTLFSLLCVSHRFPIFHFDSIYRDTHYPSI